MASGERPYSTKYEGKECELARSVAFEKQALVCLEGLQNLEREGDWILEDVDGAWIDNVHR